MQITTTNTVNLTIREIIKKYTEFVFSLIEADMEEDVCDLQQSANGISELADIVYRLSEPISTTSTIRKVFQQYDQVFGILIDYYLFVGRPVSEQVEFRIALESGETLVCVTDRDGNLCD